MEVIKIAIFKLAPACKDYLWGGHRLVEDYKINYDGKILAEAWMLSAHKDGASIIMNGNYTGKTFREYLESEGYDADKFPILIKFIDAQDILSVQVHPSNDYAQKFENQLGKHEMWYILDAAPKSFIYRGLNRHVTKEEFLKHVNENTLPEILQKVPARKGDCFFIPAGTIHSVGKGILLVEIQQNSNVSYRIYDYDRRGADGKKRDLHVDKALDVADLKPFDFAAEHYPHIAACDYFTVDKINLDGKISARLEGKVTAESFLSVLILDGRGKISVDGETLNYTKGDSFFIPANSGKWTLEGTADAILTTT